MEGIDIRCPEHPVRLLMRVGKAVHVDGANLIEVACRDCAKERRLDGEDVRQVLHRYNVLGQLVETEIV